MGRRRNAWDACGKTGLNSTVSVDRTRISRVPPFSFPDLPTVLLSPLLMAAECGPSLPPTPLSSLQLSHLDIYPSFFRPWPTSTLLHTPKVRLRSNQTPSAPCLYFHTPTNPGELSRPELTPTNVTSSLPKPQVTTFVTDSFPSGEVKVVHIFITLTRVLPTSQVLPTLRQMSEFISILKTPL